MRENVVIAGIIISAIGVFMLMFTAPTPYYVVVALVSFILIPVGIFIALIGAVLKKKEQILSEWDKENGKP
jgi:hypothetical protein